MLNERVGVVLKNVMDGKGKRRETNVRSMIAAKFQAVLKGREALAHDATYSPHAQGGQGGSSL